jgi:predicted O-methyltransferase YrrM
MIGSDDPRLLWSGYGQPGATRRPSEVCVTEQIGMELQRLCWTLCPRVVVEAGTGFGVSGWNLLHGLAAGLPRPCGHLYTFEANPEWAREARERLQSANASGFTLIVGRFEDELATAIGDQRIDLAFLDAMHTDEAVLAQWDAVMRHASPGLVVAVDDIAAVPGAWAELLSRAELMNIIEGRLGVLRARVPR